MNSRVHPPRSAGAHWARLRLVLYLGPVVAISAPILASVTLRAPHSRPYLVAVGAPTLRFAEILPPPDMSVHPPAGVLTQPAVLAEPVGSQEVRRENNDKFEAAPPPVSAETSAAKAEGKTRQPKSPILPDDTRPMVKPEDFLPFFLFPNSNPNMSDTTAGTAAPATVPPPASTATYRLQ